METEAILQLRAQLEPLGLYKYADEASIRWSIEDSAQTGRWYSEGTERVTWGDGESIADLWFSAPARTFAIVEHLLREAGSDEHIYTPRGKIAQENSAIFLTEEMYNLVNCSPLAPMNRSYLRHKSCSL